MGGEVEWVRDRTGEGCAGRGVYAMEGVPEGVCAGRAD